MHILSLSKRDLSMGSVKATLSGVSQFPLRQILTLAVDSFLRAVLHNWSDKYAVQILRNLIPALKPGAKVLVNDVVTPDPDAVPKSQEADLRAADLTMLMLSNSSHREMAEWEKLFEMADPRFALLPGKRSPGTNTWILTAEWKGN